MSKKQNTIDITFHPVEGWQVVKAWIDPEMASAITREYLPMIGWEVTVLSDDSGERYAEYEPICWLDEEGATISLGTLKAGYSAVFKLLAPGEEPDWNALHAEAKKQVRA